MSLKSLEACRRASVIEEKLEAWKRVSVNLGSLGTDRRACGSLGSLETCRRVSVSLVSLQKFSDYARVARALAVATLRHSCGPILAQLGTNLGPIWTSL